MLKTLIKLTESAQGEQAFKREAGPLMVPGKAAEERASIVDSGPDGMGVKRDDSDALRKRVTEKELKKSMSEGSMDGVAT